MLCSILEAKEAFKDIEIDVIKDLYVQSGKNKQVLFEVLLGMSDPDAQAQEPVLPAAQQHQ